MNFIDCKSIAAAWKKDIFEDLKCESKKPKLGIIQVNHDPASDAYVRGKLKDCAEVGILTDHRSIVSAYRGPTMKHIVHAINDLMAAECDGIILQLPLPHGITYNDVVDFLPDGYADVDGFHPDSAFKPCTPDAIMHLMKDIGIDVSGKFVVIAGRSDIVGKPLAAMMQEANATVAVCHSRTPRNLLLDLAHKADIFVSAVGKPNFIGTDVFQSHTIVVDVGINRVNDKLVGDIEYNMDRTDISITPVPGGVGLLTRAMLLRHVYSSFMYSGTQGRS